MKLEESRQAWTLEAFLGGIALLGIALPFTPIGPKLGFTPLPAVYFVFLAGATLTCLLLVEIAKRFLMRRTLRASAA